MSIIGILKTKYDTISVPAKASIWFVICSILQRGISLITVPIFTRLMSEEQYGVYSAYVSWYSILLIFTSLSLYNGVFNNALIKYENDKDEYISSMQGLIVVITGAFFVLYLIFKEPINYLLGMPTQIVLLLFVELLVTPALQFWTVRKRFDFKYREVVIITLIKSLINPILGIILVLSSEQKDLARIISIVVVEILFCGAIAIYQFYKGRCFLKIEYWKFAVLFNMPLIPHYLSGVLLNQGDRVMISKMVGDSEVALYSVANNIGQVMNIFTSAIVASFTPWIYRKFKQKLLTEIPQLTNNLLLLMLGLVSIVMFFGPEILRILAPSEYADAVYVIPPISASIFFVLMYNLLANIEFYYSVRIYVTIGSVLAAVCNIVLNFIFIDKYGYHAAGYTTLFCYVIYGLSHLYFSKVVAKKYMNEESMFDQKTIIVLSISVLLITLIQNYLYGYTLLRYVCIVAFITVFVLKRNVIIEKFKMMRS